MGAAEKLALSLGISRINMNRQNGVKAPPRDSAMIPLRTSLPHRRTLTGGAPGLFDPPGVLATSATLRSFEKHVSMSRLPTARQTAAFVPHLHLNRGVPVKSSSNLLRDISPRNHVSQIMREKGGNLFASGLRIYERLGPANPEDDEVDTNRGNDHHMATGPTHIWNHDKAAKERKRKATHQDIFPNERSRLTQRQTDDLVNRLYYLRISKKQKTQHQIAAAAPDAHRRVAEKARVREPREPDVCEVDMGPTGAVVEDVDGEGVEPAEEGEVLQARKNIARTYVNHCIKHHGGLTLKPKEGSLMPNRF